MNTSQRMFKFFDRYIIREIIPPFFIGLLIYSFVLLMNQIFLLSELLIAKGVSFKIGTQIFVYLIPSVLAFTVPMSVLMGILAGLSRLSSDSEIVAFKTLGIGNKRLLWPVLAFSLVGWLVTSYLTLFLAPRANYKWVQTVTKHVLAKVQLKINPREFNENIPETVLFIQDISSSNRWENIFVSHSAFPEESRIILAKSGRLNFYPELKRATLELFDGTIHTTPLNNPEKYSVTAFERAVEEINVQSLYADFSHEKRVREKDIGELFRQIKILRRSLADLGREKEEMASVGGEKNQEEKRRGIGQALMQKNLEYRSHWVEVHKKFALPFVCLIFVLLGIPLGVSTRKGGRTSGFTISLGIILVYYVIITAGEKMAMDGKISPFLGIWGGNILFLLAGLYLFAISSRELSLFAGLSRVLRIKKEAPSVEPPLHRRKKRAQRWPRLSLRFPKILDRYIMRKYLAIFTLVFLGLLLISLIVTFFERIDNIYEHKKSTGLLFEYILYRIPEFIHYSLPVTALTATLLTLGLLAKFNEITAMKACGISLYRTILSVVFLAAVVCLFSFYLQERLLPYANKKAEETWNNINDVPARSYNYLDRRWVLSKDKARIYHYTYFDPIASVFSKLAVYDLDISSWSLRRMIHSEKGHLEGNTLALLNCWYRNYRAGLPAEFGKAKEMELRRVEGGSYFLKEWREPALMNYLELKSYTAEIEEMGFETTRFKVDLSYKIAFPFVSLIMTLLGIPFAFSMGKKGALVGIGLSIVIAMVYWGAIGVFKSLGYVNFLSAFLAAWGPNLIFGLAALYLLFQLRT